MNQDEEYLILDTQGGENSGLMTSFVAAVLVASALQSSFPEEVEALRQVFRQAVEIVRPLPTAPVVSAPRNP